MTPKEKQYTIGIDIGGTNMKAVLFDGEKIIADDSLATPKDNLEHLIVMINALIEPLQEKAKKDSVKIKGIGLGISGPINFKENIIIKTPNIPFLENINLIEKLEQKIDLPIKIDNDTNCFLRAEMKLGVGKKYKNTYGIIIGTGIGGAWWLNNKIYRSPQGGAGEPGQMVIDFEDEIKLEEAYHKLSQNNPANLAEEAYRGDELAQKSYAEIGAFLGTALANIVNLIGPEAIIIGGGAVESSDLFLPQVKKNVRKFIVSPEAKKIKILKSKLGKHAGAIGAALLFS